MNRQQRRQEERLSRKPIIMSQQQLAQYKMKISREAVLFVEAVFAHALNAEFGFSTKRINRVLDKTRELSGYAAEEIIDGDDLMNWCKEKKLRL